jgi:multidrug efflux pump subunit AcrA (membrane-fusion protein)
MKLLQSIILIFITVFHHSLSAAELEAEIGLADIRQLGVPISGQVKTVMAAGSYVNAGETMLSISCGLYKAQFNQQQAIAEGLMPAVETAFKEKELADELFDRTVLSEVEHRNAELLYIKAKSQYDSSLAKVEQAKIKVAYCDLKADRSQLILKAHVMPGEMYSLEPLKPVLLTVASRNAMLATSKQALPLKKMYRVGLPVKVSVAGKKYKGKIQSIKFQPDNSVLISVTFDVFDPRLIGNKTAKIITQ